MRHTELNYKHCAQFVGCSCGGGRLVLSPLVLGSKWSDLPGCQRQNLAIAILEEQRKVFSRSQLSNVGYFWSVSDYNSPAHGSENCVGSGIATAFI